MRLLDDLGVGVRQHFLHRHRGKIGAVIASRFKPEQAHLRGDIIGSDLVAIRTGIAAGQIVRGEEADMRFDIGCADIRHECGFSGVRRRRAVGVSRGAAANKGQAGKGRCEIVHGSLPQRGD